MVILVGAERWRCAVLSHPTCCLPATRREPDCSGALSRIDLVDGVPVTRRYVMCGQPKKSLYRNMPIKTTIVAKNEFVEIGADLLARQAMIGPKAPTLQQ